MYRISSIEISEFRGSSAPLSIPLDGDVNFFIGRNGTGKTTLMNLLNAALSGDVAALSEAEFKTLEFRLKRPNDRTRPYIKIEKGFDEDGDSVISFAIAASAKSRPKRYSVAAMSNRSAWYHTPMTIGGRVMRHDPSFAYYEPIVTSIKELVSLSWISVHRSVSVAKEKWKGTIPDGDEQFESPIDRKLHQVARDFGAYFSTLDKAAAEETDKFQQVYLLSLIAPSGFESLKSVNKINVDDEKAAIRGMFSEFNIRASNYNSKLEHFTKRMAKAIQNYKPGSPISSNDFLVLTDTVRIHDAVNEWHSLLDKRKAIYSPKQQFVATVNELFFKKTVEITAGNQPQFRGENGQEIKLTNLSSGEKQLFILLGETLLQRNANCVFMADEPEISLHIDWQERLVPSLRKINPNAQIIFATHSPDVVGAYSNNAIDLEKIF